MEWFPNPKRILPQESRARYHAACVMYSNFSMLLWDAADRTGGVDGMRMLFAPILKTTLSNYLENGIRALTGPLVRGDQTTLDRHLDALNPLPERGLYSAFVDYFQETRC